MSDVTTLSSVDQFPDIELAVRKALWRAAIADSASQAMRAVADRVESGRVLSGGEFSVPKMLGRLDVCEWLFERVAARERELVVRLEELAAELAATLDSGETNLVEDALDRFGSIGPTHLGRLAQLRRRVSLRSGTRRRVAGQEGVDGLSSSTPPDTESPDTPARTGLSADIGSPSGSMSVRGDVPAASPAGGEGTA